MLYLVVGLSADYILKFYFRKLEDQGIEGAKLQFRTSFEINKIKYPLGTQMFPYLTRKTIQRHDNNYYFC